MDDGEWVSAGPSKRKSQKADARKSIPVWVSPEARALAPVEEPRRPAALRTRPRPKGQRYNPRSPTGRRHHFVETSTHGRRVCEAEPAVRGTTPVRRLRSLETVLRLCAADIVARAEEATGPSLSSYDAKSHAYAISRFYKLYDTVLGTAAKAGKTVDIKSYIGRIVKYLQQVDASAPHLTRDVAPVPFLL